MSTTLLIGRCPAAISRACSQSGEGPIVDLGEDAGGEARAELGDLDRDRRVVGGLALARRPAASSAHGVGASSAPVIACTSRATP